MRNLCLRAKDYDMTTHVFIDGATGTTGIEIRDRLVGRDELSLITLSEADRKDAAARKAALNDADVVILCLPDDAAREAVSLVANRSEEHTSELQSLMRTSYAVFCLKK